jgi:hypothetical protein
MKSLILLLVFFSAVLSAQHDNKIIGTITYISSQNFYVRFESTNRMSIGDTIYISETGTGIGIIQYLSSQSAACSYLTKSSVELNSQVYAFKKINNIESTSTVQEVEEKEDSFTKEYYQPQCNGTRTKDEFGISGRFSLRSFTNYSTSSSHAQNQYWRYSLSLRGKNVGFKNLDFQSSATYGYRADNWKNSGNFWNNLRVYDFFFSYQTTAFSNIQAGRIRNQNVYSLSTFDGVLFDYAFSKFTIGTFVGSHPDWKNMGVNIKLLQYGVFLSREDSLGGITMSNNLSFANQTNSGITDRRFLYFLHHTRLTDLSFTLSSEIDLYEVELKKAKSVFKPTNIYASALYRFDKKLSFDISYDARKTIYYFESFRSTLDSILDSRMRQAVRFGVLYQFSRTLAVGLNGGFAKQNDDLRPSFNAGASVSLTEITKLYLAFIGDFTYLQSNFLNGFAYGIKVNKNFLANDLNVGLGLRRVDYFFAQNTSDGIAQNIVNADLRWRVLKSLYFNFVYEFVNEKRVTANRLFVGFSQSF